MGTEAREGRRFAQTTRPPGVALGASLSEFGEFGLRIREAV